MQPRFTAPERKRLEEMVNDHMPLKVTAEVFGCHPTAVSREVRRNRAKCSMIAKSKFTRNRCAKKNSCKVRGACGSAKCKKKCISCTFLLCTTRCAHYVEQPCAKTDRWPYVCNRCKDFPTCPDQRYVYDAARAQRIATSRASMSRRGIDLDAAELARIDELITPLILKGQSLYHIWINHRYDIGVSLSTLYSYVNLGLFSACRANLPRAVHFKPRKKEKDKNNPRAEIGERTYHDYLTYLTETAMDDSESKRRYDSFDVEADTVIGRPGGKCLFTIVFCQSELFLARLLDKKTQECVIDALGWLERVFKRHRQVPYGGAGQEPWWFFNTFLTDNGTEMGDFLTMEKTVFKKAFEGMVRMHLFYTDPYCSWQKPRVEVAHTLLRRVLPKGVSFDGLTQTDIDLICSHINSYSRENLDGATPFKMAPSDFSGDGLIAALGLTRIDPDDINLTPGLLKG